MNKLVLVVTMAVAWMAGAVEAFAPPSARHTTFRSAARSSVPLLTSTTTTDVSVTEEEQQRLTDLDEEILFGEEDAGASHHERRRDMFGNVLADKTIHPNPLDHAKDPLINKLHTIRETVQSCPELWLELAKTCPDLRAVYDEHNMCDGATIEQTFGQFSVTVQKSAAVFQRLGVRKGTHVAVLGENSAVWLAVDQGVQLAGGATAVRGADAPVEELRYIYEHCDSAAIAVLQGPRLLQKLVVDSHNNKSNNSLGLSNEKHGPVKTIVLMHREKKSNEDIAKMAADLKIDIYVFSDLLDAAAPIAADARPKLQKADLATIVYTSGTTGHPKGVMLTQGNLLHQVGHRLAPTQPYEEAEPLPGETMVSLLPVWHITERSFELWMASRGCGIVYSSPRTFRKDLARHRPEWMVVVPRVLEKVAAGVQDKFAAGSAAVRVLSRFFTNVGRAHAKHQKIVRGLVVSNEPVSGLDEVVSRVALALIKPVHALGNKLVWSKVRDGFGGRVKVIISGGSALAGGLESFYETAGLTVCVGYGLTECSPLISFRRSDRNLVAAGCTGHACADTEFRIVDASSAVADVATDKPRASLPVGEAGLVIAKGPQVMKGYYKNKEATDKAIDKFGWFDTGDLGRVNPATGDLILTGRAKDTIVLSNGENIEPVPIEDAILGAGPLIDQVMLMGQDGRRIIAITVLNPQELANGGYLDRKQADALQEAIEKVNDPKCSIEDCEANCKLLVDSGKQLRSNRELNTAVSDVLKGATADFRQWEKISDFYLTLEPFAMANGQLTQSYKVKRAQVMERYASELPN